MKKCISSFLILGLLSGCSNSNYEPESITSVERVNPQIAFTISSDYLNYLKQKDFKGISKISSDDLNANTNYSFKGDMTITSFNKSEFGELGSRVFVKYNVNSIGEKEPTASLEDYTVYVRQIGNDGVVEKVTAKENLRAFVKNNNLRIVSEDNGFSKLLLRWSDLPKEVYPEYNKANIAKKQVVFNRFGVLGFNYTGTNVGISAICDGGEYIGLLSIDKSIATASQSAQQVTDSDSTEEMGLEKPVAKKMTTLDFIEGGTVEKIIFAKDESRVVIQYNINGVSRLNIYKVDDGKIVDCNSNELFPKEQYNMVLYDTAEDGIFVDINANVNVGANQSVLGRYFLNLKDSKFYKI